MVYNRDIFNTVKYATNMKFVILYGYFQALILWSEHRIFVFQTYH